MTSGLAIHEGRAAQLAELDAGLDRTLGPSRVQPPRVVPKIALRERLRRPLLILFPVLLVAAGAAYYLAERALRFDGRRLRPRGEGVDQRPGCRAGGRHRRQGQSACRGVSSCSESIRNHTRLPSIRPRRSSTARGCRSTSSRPPTASKLPNSNRRMHLWTSTCSNMRDRKRSSTTVGRRVRSLSEPT